MQQDPRQGWRVPSSKLHPEYTWTACRVSTRYCICESLISCCQEVGGQKVKGHPSVLLNPVPEPKGEREEILKKPVKISTGIYVRVLELLCGYMSKADVPAIIKEPLFLIIAQVLRLIRKDDADGASASPRHNDPTICHPRPEEVQV